MAMEVPGLIVVIDVFCPQRWRLFHLLSEEVVELLSQRLLLRSQAKIQKNTSFDSSKANNANADRRRQRLVSHVVGKAQLGILYLTFASSALKLKVKLI